MKIGIIKEIKNNEGRIGVTPASVKQYVKHKNQVFVEKNAGILSGFSDKEYIKAGAKIVTTATAWEQAMIIKVKEPLASEYKYFKPGQIIYTYFHLADNRSLTDVLLKKRTVSIAYETMVKNNSLPLLAPMSRVAGRKSVLVCAAHLEKHQGGSGILPGGVEGTEKGQFVIIGGGVAGYNAAYTALGLGANTTILEANLDRIKTLKKDGLLNGLAKLHKAKLVIEKASPLSIAKWVKVTDALISTILIRGEVATKVVTEKMVKSMRPGSVIVDIAIDQGGSIATVDRITTHDKPTYIKHGIIHYAVANMPGATPRTSTIALDKSTLEYGLKIAKYGIKAGLTDPTILSGFNTINGKLTCEPVAKTFKDLKYIDPLTLIK